MIITTKNPNSFGNGHFDSCCLNILFSALFMFAQQSEILKKKHLFDMFKESFRFSITQWFPLKGDNLLFSSKLDGVTEHNCKIYLLDILLYKKKKKEMKLKNTK